MFPLGTVLLPDGVLPLRVFEPRYVTMLEHLRDGGGEFGVVLIERGSEVGGGEVRTDVGTLAELARAEPLPAGQWAVTAVGRARLRVDRWVDDDPYPRAEVTVEGDGPPPTLDDLSPVHHALVELRGALVAVGVSVAGEIPPLEQLVDDDRRHRFVYWAANLAQPGPLDAQRVLTAADGPHRAAVAAEVIADKCELLRLGMER